MKTANPSSPFLAPARGFTLLELMTALAVLGILIGIGVPSFNSMMRDSQVASESNNLYAALTLARSEALKRGIRVSVCPPLGIDTNKCDEDGDWSKGWIVFSDDFGSAGVHEESDVTLQVFQAPASGITVTTTSTAVTFERTGRAEFEESFDISKASCTKDQKRQIDIDFSGRVSLARVSCSS